MLCACIRTTNYYQLLLEAFQILALESGTGGEQASADNLSALV